MAGRDMRLRLVVRRDGLPEERLMWNVSLEDNPTISKLLEKINETLPLEIDQKGLENYVVELRDEDGTTFECLHFQLVRTVLKPDDRVFIRALDRDDNIRRRISGRHQISSDGRHLIDGIPFGRRRLRAPTNRPPIPLPPRKRRRLAYHRGIVDDDLGGGEDTSMLLLTDGEKAGHRASSPTVRIGAGFHDADAEDENFESEGKLGDSSDSDSHSRQSSGLLSDEDNLEEELRDLVDDNATFRDRESDSRVPTREGYDKISILQAAFPSAPVGICEKILETSGGDVKAAYRILADGFEPKLPESAFLGMRFKEQSPWKSKSKSPGKAALRKVISGEHSAESFDDTAQEDDALGDDDGEEGQVSAFVRQFDHCGLPPGSITSGKGLSQMAAISSSFGGNKSGEQRNTAPALLNGGKVNPKEMADEDDETSSDATSSSSNIGDSEFSDNGSDSSGHSDGGDGDSDDDSSSPADGLPGSSHNNASTDSDSQNDDVDNDSDDGPEESSTKPKAQDAQGFNKKSRRPNTLNQGYGSELSDSSDGSTSEGNLEGESRRAKFELRPESDGVGESSGRLAVTKADGNTLSVRSVQQAHVSQPSNAVLQVQPVPPGAGKERTKKRNARRRAAKKAKKLVLQATVATTSPTAEGAQSRPPVLDEKARFEAKRQELLDAIAAGGVEVGSPGEPGRTSRTPTTKRKHDEHDQLEPRGQNAQGGTAIETPINKDAHSSTSAQKRIRVDVGAGRRLLFGALGLRNPKTKRDEDELRAKLMKDVQLPEDPRLKRGKDDPPTVDEDNEFVDKDVDAWRDKITYRAVECCYEGVELSEPPFPFVQRWDPQQQGAWFQKKNKRGGRSKRSQRNQAHFYQDTSQIGKKRKHEDSSAWDEGDYNTTFNGIDEHTNSAYVELNYDDTEDGQRHEMNEPTNNTSQFTDIDDLPSLPSDMTTLPALHPGEVQVGMVITWQQWSCSSATNWQPQLSNVTGVVVRIDDDATGLEVCLAKRDRYLDRNRKKYDENTGQRIYDRFEAPDLDEDEDDDGGYDEGFRTIGFAEMQQPRILQQPLSIMTASEEPSRCADIPVNISPGPENDPPAGIEDSGVGANSGPSNIKGVTEETVSDNRRLEVSEPGQGELAGDTSTSSLSQTSSPSRQLHEHTGEAINVNHDGRSVRGSPRPECINSDMSSDKPSPEVSESGSRSARQLSAPLFDGLEEEVMAGTPRVVKSKATIPPSSASSVQSGRQPDRMLDPDTTEPGSLRITDDGASVAPDAENHLGAESDEEASTPTPRASDQVKPATSQEEVIARRKQTASPANPSTPGSPSSINTVWCTALTSRDTQSPSKYQSQSLATRASQKARASKDQEYEEAMRKLENTFDHQQSSLGNPDISEQTSPVGALDDTTGNGIVKASSRSPRIKASPSPITKRKPSGQPSQFALPPGTQVVELSSDSEPAYAEDYADDEVDGTYTPEVDSLPKGNGWVRKKMDVGNRSRRSTTESTRPPPVKKRQTLSSSQGRQSTSSSTSVSGPNQTKPRRKTSSRF